MVNVPHPFVSTRNPEWASGKVALLMGTLFPRAATTLPGEAKLSGKAQSGAT